MSQLESICEEIEVICEFNEKEIDNLANNLKLRSKQLKANRFIPQYKMSMPNVSKISHATSDDGPGNNSATALIPISDREIQMLLGTIPEYHPGGNLSLFIQKVDKLLEYLSGRLTPTLAYIVQDTIQLKIKGEAENFIACLNPSNWDDIRSALLRKYGDQRSEEILANELRKVTQFKGESYSDFYSKIIVAFNKIMEHLQLNIHDQNIIVFKRHEYSQLAVNTFKYGILEPYRSYLKHFQITSLEEGLQMCNKYDNEKIQEEYHEFIRERSQRKFTSNKPPHKTFSFPQNNNFQNSTPNFAFRSFNKPQFNSQFQNPQYSSHFNKSHFGNFNNNMQQTSKAQSNSQIVRKTTPFEKANNPEPMSVQSRVPTRQFQNRFSNHFQTRSNPQFLVQELTNLETRDSHNKTLESTYKNPSEPVYAEQEMEELNFPMEASNTSIE